MYRFVFESFLFVLVMFAVMIAPAHAYKLTPISAEMSPTGKKSRYTFRIENTNTKPVAIEMGAFKRSMDIKGNDVLTPASSDFIIYPQQMIVMPGQSQAVRVDWLGKKNPDKELAYRIITEQLPINFESNKSDGGQISLLVRFLASVYIKPDNAKPEVVLSSSHRHVTDAKKPYIKLVFKNNGKAHSLLRNPRLQLSSLGKSIVLEKEQLEQLKNQNVLAGHAREFMLPWPENLPAGEVEADFSYEVR